MVLKQSPKEERPGNSEVVSSLEGPLHPNGTGRSFLGEEIYSPFTGETLTCGKDYGYGGF